MSNGGVCYLMILVEKRLVEEVRKHDTLIIVGETGSGKTTRMVLTIMSFVICVWCIVNAKSYCVSVAFDLIVFP